jgi:hypothetical protein
MVTKSVYTLIIAIGMSICHVLRRKKAPWAPFLDLILNTFTEVEVQTSGVLFRLWEEMEI